MLRKFITKTSTSLQKQHKLRHHVKQAVFANPTKFAAATRHFNTNTKLQNNAETVKNAESAPTPSQPVSAAKPPKAITPLRFLLHTFFLRFGKYKNFSYRMLIYMLRIGVLYGAACLLLYVYHRYLQNPKSEHWPIIYKYITPAVQLIEGSTRFVRTMSTTFVVGLDYKYTFMTVPDDEYNSNEELRSKLHRRNAKRFLKLFTDNGGIYIKVGQYMASLVGVLPKEYGEELSVLQDQAPWIPTEEVERVIVQEFGKSLSELFVEFPRDPIAAASIAQVHKAKIRYQRKDPKTGKVTEEIKEVAVKVQYPKVRFNYDGDMVAHDAVLFLMKTFFKGVDYSFLGADLKTYLQTELDFINEASNQRRAAKNFSHRHDVYVPEIIDHLSSERVLTTEFIYGVKVNNAEAIKALGLDIKETAQSLMEAFAEQIFISGFLHADPHAGNVFVRRHPDNPRKPQIIVLDHGLYRELSDDFRISFCKLYKALVLGDEKSLKRYCDDLGIEDSKYFAAILLMRSWESNNIGLSSGMTLEEIHAYRNMLIEQAEGMVQILKRLPRDMLLVLRNNNLLRSINQELGVPVNRFTIFARMAAKGAFLTEKYGYSSTYDATKLEEFYSNKRQADSKNIEGFSTRFKAWKELIVFEWKLKIHEWKVYLIDLFFRVQIWLGLMKPFNIETFQVG